MAFIVEHLEDHKTITFRSPRETLYNQFGKKNILNRKQINLTINDELEEKHHNNKDKKNVKCYVIGKSWIKSYLCVYECTVKLYQNQSELFR